MSVSFRYSYASTQNSRGLIRDDPIGLPEHPPAGPGDVPHGMTPRDPAIWIGTLVENIRILAISFELIAPKLQQIRAVLVSDLVGFPTPICRMTRSLDRFNTIDCNPIIL